MTLPDAIGRLEEQMASMFDHHFDAYRTMEIAARGHLTLTCTTKSHAIAQPFDTKGYQPDMLPSWPSDKPIFLPENMVPEQMKQKPK